MSIRKLNYNTMKPRNPSIKIKVYGKNKKFNNDYLKDATEFFLRLLFAGKRYKINVTVSSLKGLKDRQHVDGTCERLDGPKNPRNFRIELDNNLTRQETLETIAHETVHVAQYVTDTMREGKGRAIIFNDKQYYLDPEDPASYYFSPWEIDAYGRSIGLVYLWKSSLLRAKKNKKIG